MSKRTKAERQRKATRTPVRRAVPAAGVNVSGGVPASEVKNAWHAFLDRVSQSREEIVITRYGKPIARLAPIAPAPEEPRRGLVGSMAGTIEIHGDIIEPIDVVWEANA